MPTLGAFQFAAEEEYTVSRLVSATVHESWASTTFTSPIVLSHPFV
jgi:hypothetical protein